MKCSRLFKITASLFLGLFLSSAIVSSAWADSCPYCGGTLEAYDTIPAYCETDGATYYVCDSCRGQVTVTTPALGHSYITETSASCTEPGLVHYTCTRCQDDYEEGIGPLGHSYAVTREEYCEAYGTETYTCTRCNDSYFKTIPAIGHLFRRTVTEADCEHDGDIVDVCDRCGMTLHTAIPSQGHDFEAKETPPSCTEKGLRTGTCKVCGKEVREEIPATGHDFGEWEVITPPSLFRTGEEIRECSFGDSVENHILPKKSIKESPAAIGTIVVLVLGIAAGIGFAIKKAALLTAAGAAAEAASLGMITLQMKKLIVYLKDTETNRDLLEQMRKRPYLDIKTVPYGELEELAGMVGDERPDMVILSSEASPILGPTLTELSAACKDTHFSVIDETDHDTVALTALKDSRKIINYALSSDSTERKIIKLALPLYKPDKSSGNWAENATLVTDALGFPIISFLLNTFVVGGDVVEAVKARGMGVADTSDFVNDVAGMLGLDVLANIAEVLRVSADQHERGSDNRHK